MVVVVVVVVVAAAVGQEPAVEGFLATCLDALSVNMLWARWRTDHGSMNTA